MEADAVCAENQKRKGKRKKGLWLFKRTLASIGVEETIKRPERETETETERDKD